MRKGAWYNEPDRSKAATLADPYLDSAPQRAAA